jgi:hypothetical protein
MSIKVVRDRTKLFECSLSIVRDNPFFDCVYHDTSQDSHDSAAHMGYSPWLNYSDVNSVPNSSLASSNGGFD